MFAIIQASGRQFRVNPGDIIEVQGHHTGDAELAFEEVLLVGRDAGEIVTGAPFVTGARVVGRIEALDRGRKVRVFKKKRRKQYRRTKGHRDYITRVRIIDIVA